MLKSDKAEKELEKFQSESHFDSRLARVKRLAKGPKEVGCLLLGRDEDGKVINNWERRNKLMQKLPERLDGLPAKARTELFAALLPKLAKHLEHTWKLFATLPYQAGYLRKSFRAPAHAVAARTRRFQWLEGTLERLQEYDPDIEWLATWAGYLYYGSSDDNSGYTLAAAINAGGKDGETVFDIVKQSASNQHPIGAMGRHVTRALLVCERPEAWTFMEKFLLAAQRQEGLRQVILETVDEAHPQAYRRMLRLIRDHGLARFSSVVRSVNVWFGFLWDSVSQGVVNKVIDKVSTFLDDSKAVQQAIKDGNAEDVYLALWAIAFDDIDGVFKPAEQLLAKGKTETRYATITLLRHLHTPLAQKQFLASLEDPDLRVALAAYDGLTGVALPSAGYDDDDYYDDDDSWKAEPVKDMFERCEKLLQRLPDKPQKLKPLVWPWAEVSASKQHVAEHLPDCVGNRPADRLIPYLPFLNPWQKMQAMETLMKRKPLAPKVRELLFTMVRDPASYVREQAVEAIKKLKLDDGEAEKLEMALTRSNAALRRGVLGLLAKQKEQDCNATVERLLVSANKNQRLAGLDLLVSLADDRRAGEARRARGETFRADRGKFLSEDEAEKLTSLVKTGLPKPTLDDGLGLLNPAEMSKPAPPKKHPGFEFMSDAAMNVIKALDDLIHKHQEHAYTVKEDGKTEEKMIGTDGFPYWKDKLSAKKNFARMPLRELWQSWYDSRPKNQRDKDGMELYRAQRWLSEGSEWQYSDWKDQAKGSPGMKAAFDAFTGGHKWPKVRYEYQVASVIDWFRKLNPEPNLLAWQVDAAEAAYALVPQKELDRSPKEKNFTDWREQDLFDLWADDIGLGENAGWTPALVKRYWGLMRWKEQSVPKARRQRSSTDLLYLAYRHGAATRADLIDSLIGQRKDDEEESPHYYYWHSNDFDALSELTQRKPGEDVEKFLKARPEVPELVEHVKARVLEVELDRGELDTAATAPAKAINSLVGADMLFTLLRKLGKKKLERSSYGSGYASVFSHLISATHPKPTDTPEDFAALAKAAVKDGKVPEGRFLELAFYAPQWLKFVAAYLGWPGYEEGMYWFQAHIPDSRHFDPTKGEVEEENEYDYDDDDTDDDEDEDGEKAAAPKQTGPKSGWEKLLAERTPLTTQDRREGAVDAAWFWRAFEPLGGKKWEAMAAAAKYSTSYGSGAKKAAFLSSVLRGKVKKRDLVRGIRERQLKENVRCLGLLPLATGQKREPDLMNRYKILQGFLRYAKSLGPMSREFTVRTAHIGLENLARTAGYPDPIRLEWAMEAKAVADLKAGPITRTVAGVTVTLSLDDQGLPETTFVRGDKELKSLPPPVRKDRKVADMLERKKDLRRQASRMKWSLESAMIRGDAFTGTELRTIFEHPMLEPLLSRLVLIGDGIMGYPVKGGKGLENHAGKVEPVKADEQLRIAHCHDLFTSKQWHLWQADLFRRERIQPFKQVFRELYLLSDAEKADHDKSTRYGGQQVNPMQANALWAARGWATKEEVRRRFHEAGISAEVFFQYGVGTPMEVEGLTLDAVRFYRKNEWKPMALADVPPRIFSEVMRDCDLVVSVAHRGGVDPEASQSTVEMRAALLRETCSLLKMANVRVQGNRALIEGELNKYSLHLGSGVVHRMPGGSVCIIPVHSQHRGRLFLPFADDDPKTAEVVSKTILLARDAEIQDPTILDQLRMTV